MGYHWLIVGNSVPNVLENFGEFSVTQKAENGILEIESVSGIKVERLFSYRIQYIQNTIYKRGILESSHVRTFENGKLNSDI